MSDDEALSAFEENEFFNRILGVLPNLIGAVRLIMTPRLENGLRPDLMATLKDSSVAIIEVKNISPNTQQRLAGAAEQLKVYGRAWEDENPRKKAQLILVVPGALSQDHIRYLRDQGIDQVIDGPTLSGAIATINVSDADFFQATGEAQAVETGPAAKSLLEDLANTSPGQDDWAKYQKLCGLILSYLFCPPLGQPRSELPNVTRHNRRDFILSNHTPDTFWSYMRSTYNAHYIVVDAKNWTRTIRKNEILQLANYLSPHGPGLFGVIMSRNGGGDSAALTQREQWAFHRKMTVVLDDSDTKQMIALRESDGNPSDLIQQKIEDFRLGF